MKRLRRSFEIVAILLAIPVLSFAAGHECINWPKLMSQQAIGGATEGKIVVAEPFTDYTKQTGDEWMSVGLGISLRRWRHRARGSAFFPAFLPPITLRRRVPHS